MDEIRRYSMKDAPNDSRYKNLERIQYTENEEIIETQNKITIPYSVNDKSYTVQVGEEGRLDLISNKVYGTPMYWWILAQASNIYDPFSISVGDRIRVPSLSTVLGTGVV